MHFEEDFAPACSVAMQAMPLLCYSFLAVKSSLLPLAILGLVVGSLVDD